MFHLRKKYADEIVSHARAEAPNECCGILAGAKGKVVKIYPATNAEHSPFRYNVAPEELLAIYQELEDKGWDLLGIYHSHTSTGAYPSERDIKYAFWSDARYFIVSLHDQVQPDLRVFRIAKGVVVEEELRIIE